MVVNPFLWKGVGGVRDNQREKRERGRKREKGRERRRWKGEKEAVGGRREREKAGETGRERSFDS